MQLPFLDRAGASRSNEDHRKKNHHVVSDGGGLGDYRLVPDQYGDRPPIYSNSVSRDFIRNRGHLRHDSLHAPTMNQSGRAYRRSFILSAYQDVYEIPYC